MKLNILFCFFLSFKAITANISAGQWHTLFIDNNMQVWGCGNNVYGQLGEISYCEGVIHEIASNKKIKAVATSSCNSYFLDENNEVWSVGNNQHGQLGNNKYQTKRIILQKIANLINIVSLDIAEDHSIFLNMDGQVFTCGFGKDGRLGHGNESTINLPMPIDNLPVIKSVSVGYEHSLLLDENNHVWSFGNNKHGQLGISDIQKMLVPIQIECELPIIAISAGSFHNLLLDKNPPRPVWFRFKKDQQPFF